MKNKNGDILFENQNQLHHLKFLFISDFSSFLFVSPSLIYLIEEVRKEERKKNEIQDNYKKLIEYQIEYIFFF